MIVYDIEIMKAIQGRNEPRAEGIEYCAGWNDKANMGVSVIGAYDVLTGRTRVFTEGNFDEFESLARARIVAGFNSIAFDDVVCGHHGIKVETTYDLLQEVWVAAGLGRKFVFQTHAGYGLDAMAKANGHDGKTGWGGSAPADWQRGHYGKVIDYCLEDVRLTWKLLEQVSERGWLFSPKREGEKLLIRNPRPVD